MKREWKPGDLAYVGGDGEFVNFDLKSVILIDQTSREQVERLAVAYATVESARSGDEYRAWENRSAEARGRIVDSLSAALREYANPKPPKPDEPMGLGAVVETVHGELYVRDKATTTVAHWKRARGEESGKRHRYADLDVVRVHSQGWEVDQ